jgi:excisionase family DNA binding protein
MIELVTVDEAAARLRISRRSVYRLIGEGKLRPVHPTPGRTLLTSREVDAYIASLDRRRVA